MHRFWAILLTTAILLPGCAPAREPPRPPDAAVEESATSGWESAAPSTADSEAYIDENYIADIADELIKNIVEPESAPGQKILAAYRWLMENVYFADPVSMDIWRYRSGQQTPPSFEEAHSISPLVFGIGSCEDFACAMVFLLWRMGFEARYVPGYTISVDGGYVDHAWAVVNMNGSWYHLDPQLEQNVARNGSTRYRYFLKTDAELLADHKWGENLIEFWPDISEDDAERIRREFTPPACVTQYPPLAPEPLQKPPKPDIQAIKDKIEREVNPLPPLDGWDVTPPVLIRPVGRELSYARQFLPAADQLVYDEITEAARRFSVPIRVPVEAGFPEQRFQSVCDAILSDCPELYWLAFSMESDGGNRFFAVNLRPGDSVESVRENSEALLKAADALIPPGIDGFEATLAAHDEIARRVQYDREQSEGDSANAFGALVEGRAVCEGFAKAYQLALQRRGIPCVFFRGSTTRGTSHAWNANRIDGEWYYTDVTWDRPDDRSPVRHEYLNVTGDEIRREHIFDAQQYPVFPDATATGGSYYARTGRAASSKTDAFLEPLAGAFLSGLADGAKTVDGRAYLEAKLFVSEDDYREIKTRFLKDPYAVLAAMERLARQREIAPAFAATGELQCNYNDAMRILVLLPSVR